MPAKKSASADLKETAFYFIFILAGYYLIMGIWKVLTNPLRALLTSDKTKLARTIKIAQEKKDRRDHILFHSREVEYNAERGQTVLLPIWDRDENALDSDLMAVPTIYDRDYNRKYYINEEFLDYLQQQVEMHLSSSFRDQHNFLRTIRKYYPEFTPKFSVIPSEIEALREEAKSARLTEELIAEVVKSGIPDRIVKKLILRNADNPEGFKKDLAVAKKYNPCLIETLLFCLDHGYSPDKEVVQQLDRVLMLKSEEMAVSLVKGEITYEDFQTFDKKDPEHAGSTVREYKRFMAKNAR